MALRYLLDIHEQKIKTNIKTHSADCHNLLKGRSIALSLSDMDGTMTDAALYNLKLRNFTLI